MHAMFSWQGILFGVTFAAAMAGIIWWMFHVPAQVSAPVARIRRSLDASRRIMVPVVDAAYSGRGVELACRLGHEQKSEILLVHVIEVPRTLPLGAPLPAAEKAAADLLQTAKEIVELHGLTASIHIERAREASEGIIRAARDQNAQLIVMGVRPKIGGTETLGRASAVLLRRAPCEVVLDRTVE